MILPDEYRKRLTLLDERIGELYRERRTVMEQFSDEHPAVLPPKRQRTETQRRVERCPRCGGKLPE